MKRKYDYIFFDDGKKERITHWFKLNVVNGLNEFMLFTKNNVYWYCECDLEDRFERECKRSTFIRVRNCLYQLKDGTHRLTLDKNDWISVQNFNRFELVINNVEG